MPPLGGIVLTNRFLPANKTKANDLVHRPLFPLNRRRWFGADIVTNTIDTSDFVNNP